MVGITELTEEFAVGAYPTEASAGEIDPVIAFDAADESGFAGLSLNAPVGPR